MNSLIDRLTASRPIQRWLLAIGLLLMMNRPALAQAPGQLAIYTAIEVEFGTEARTLYQLEGSSNMVDWTAVDQPRCGTGLPITLLLSTRGRPSFQFYRLQILATQTNCAEPDSRGLVLIGHSDHVTTAANLLGVGGLNPRQNTLPEPDDVVLFTVSAVDGPMPETRSQIDAIKGKPHGPAAILLVYGFQQPDQELRDLVVLEIRELLKSLQQPGVDAMPVIYDDQADVLDRIRALLAQGGAP